MRIKDYINSAEEKNVQVEGWVRTKREGKNVAFLEVSDGSSVKGLQVVLDKEKISKDCIDKITTGSSVIVKGDLVPSLGGEQKSELNAQSITVIGCCPDDYPLQKKHHTVEFLREKAHLRARTNLFGSVARVRNTMAYAIHSFFQENGFVYVHTPIISSSDCEGAGAQFRVTTLDLEEIAKSKEGRVDYSKDFFSRPSFLTVSGQLEGETYALALKDIYTFGPTFRAENSNTARHLAEFWMIEPEMAFCRLEGDMDLAERFLKYVFKKVLDNNEEEMKYFENLNKEGIIETLQNVIESPFEHMSYTEAIKILEKNNDNFEFPLKWGEDIQSEHERYLTEVVARKPVIVTDYPKEIKAFYMLLNDDEKTVRAMDVLVPRLGEIIGGSEREYRYDVLLDRIEKLGLDSSSYWWYLDLRKYGTVPHAGFGLGFERAVQYVTGVQNIRDVIPYPRYVGNSEF